jgi:hypothetical protein
MIFWWYVFDYFDSGDRPAFKKCGHWAIWRSYYMRNQVERRDFRR